MDTVIELLIQYGYWGMFIAAFIAGSVFPFSSEAVMAGLQLAGLNPMSLLIWGTLGNVAGSMFNYWIGSLGKMEWIEKYFKVDQKQMDKATRFIHGRGSWMALFSFLPVIGDAILIVLGLMRANIWIVAVSMTVGKLLRYALLVAAALGIIHAL